MPQYPITISSRSYTPEVRKNLKRKGLSWDGIEYHGMVSKNRLKKLQLYADEEGLTFRIDNELGRRRADYRRRYFSSHPPDIGNRYICVYCGKWMTRENTTVDHLYPVGRTARDLKLQKKLAAKGIQNINDPKNLVAACKRCNDRKKDSMRLWILRGRLGRLKWLWGVRYAVRGTVVASSLIGILIVIINILK